MRLSLPVIILVAAGVLLLLLMSEHLVVSTRGSRQCVLAAADIRIWVWLFGKYIGNRWYQRQGLMLAERSVFPIRVSLRVIARIRVCQKFRGVIGISPGSALDIW